MSDIMIDCTFNVKTENFGRVFKKLKKLGFIPETDDDCNIVDLEYKGVSVDEYDPKLDQIAPYVEDGSVILMLRTNGTIWRWVFTNGKVKIDRPRISWSEDEE